MHALAKQQVGECLIVEPHIQELPKALAELSGVSLVSIDEAFKRADIVLLLVGHTEFEAIDITNLSGKVIIDTCGIW